ncbi:maltose permease [Saccharomyces cerevisiae YJM789]|uniref:Maltose permease n=2 Tax=Saccharomyces cerevisiae TaxID=4932 RepID=A6ZLN7_YEAS7|nr:maltose permease [Saccharomyces cerevisiae YJM789]CAI4283944.1 ABA_G0004850.mRNA.1.CDS.1 [Saccharomyces cerevisiae]CAI6512272.1 ABA_G0004850.mRNA.1.CDS.1 [Saccharomyces cerevisiae]
MKGLSSLINRKKDRNDSHLDEIENGVNATEFNSVEMEEQGKKSDFDLSHHEYGPGSLTPNDNNEEVPDLLDEAMQDAKEADESERGMPLMTALKTYPKAAAWSLLVSTTLIQEGYDTAILGSFYALPVFQKKYGSLNSNTGDYEISVSWQIGLCLCYMAGEIVGLQMTGPSVDYMGNRYTLIMALFFLAAFIFILYFCKSLGMIAVGQALCGMPWGCFQCLTVSYASEICPLALRYYLTTYSNLCWAFGQLFAAGIMKNSQNKYANSELGYKLPFALQWIWPLPLAVGIFFAPESPWWLVKKGRIDQARRSLERTLSGKGPEKELLVSMELDKIKTTIEKEQKMSDEGTYWDCVKDGINRRRTRIACLCWIGQCSCGASLIGYSTYFYEKAGVSTDTAFTFSIIQYCLGIAATFISWWASKYCGRFDLYAFGLAFQAIMFFIIGGLGCSDTHGAKMGSGALLMVVAFFYNLGIAPVVFCLVSEIPSSRLRTKTIILARNAYNVIQVVVTVLIMYQLNSEKWNWGAKSGFFWGGFCLATLAWAVVDLPETAGRTFIEINELFRLGVPARKFKSTKVDPFAAAKAAAAEINVKDPKEDLETSVVDEGRSTSSVVNK